MLAVNNFCLQTYSRVKHDGRVVHCCTYMQHDGYCLHLNLCGNNETGSVYILNDVRVEVVFRLQLTKRPHWIGNVRSTHVDLVGSSECVDLNNI